MSTAEAAPSNTRGRWFREARFGVFIHWGLYSVHGRCVWAAYRERMSISEYAKLADRFDAADYRPDQWVTAAKLAGAKYMVMCTRQHPGFSLFDTKVSDFSAPKTAAGRDLIAEYVEACRKHDMRIGFYYSLLDWRYPAYFNGPETDPAAWSEYLAFVHAQVEELCTNYGKIDIMWYDMPFPWPPEAWRSKELNALVRELQPGILINRSGLPEDFGTPEQHIPNPSDSRMWESCMTMNDHWGYNPNDGNWKSPAALIQMLATCATRGGNLLLNVGPTPGGAFPPEALERLSIIGNWMAKNGESIYGTDRISTEGLDSRDHIHGPLSLMGAAGCKGDKVFLHIFHWPGDRIVADSIENRVVSARFLATGVPIRVRQDEERFYLENLPRTAPDPYDTVIELELDGPPRRRSAFRPLPI